MTRSPRRSAGNESSRLCGMLLATALLFVLAAGTTSAQSRFLTRFLERDVPVVTVTDRTDAGKKLRVPSREHPLYYEALVLGETSYGKPMANTQPPKKKEFLKLILKLLADQGYFPATPKHDPEVLLAVSWGTMNQIPSMSLVFMGGDKADVMWELEGLTHFNPLRWLHRDARSPEATFIVDCSSDNLYMISIQAFDEDLAQRGVTQLLWHTKVSCPAAGLAMAPSLKQMARQAAPLFGRETAKPVLTRAPLHEGRVDLGELKALAVIDPDKLPITDTDDGPEAVGFAAAAARSRRR